ncbi:hypothetical protein Trydic_g15791, partial [Trypoxylus dichotomus]
KRHIVKNQITFDDYLDCLRECKETFVDQKIFKSEGHQASTIKQTKTALSPHDNKRYVVPGTYDTLSWGHWSIMESS